MVAASSEKPCCCFDLAHRQIQGRSREVSVELVGARAVVHRRRRCCRRSRRRCSATSSSSATAASSLVLWRWGRGTAGRSSSSAANTKTFSGAADSGCVRINTAVYGLLYGCDARTWRNEGVCRLTLQAATEEKKRCLRQEMPAFQAGGTTQGAHGEC
jgi:hypothetical protein